MANRFLSRISPKAQRRFWQKIRKSGPDDCWPWLGALTESGYGNCYPYGARVRGYRAHRIAVFLTTGTDPGDLGVIHSCDNPPCCNPAHLSAATHKENMQDMHTRGRAGDCRIFAEDHGRCVLTDEQVEQIRSASFGISRAQIHRIVAGESRLYRTVEAPRRPRHVQSPASPAEINAMLREVAVADRGFGATRR
jgi:HNH endonuclease